MEDKKEEQTDIPELSVKFRPLGQGLYCVNEQDVANILEVYKMLAKLLSERKASNESKSKLILPDKKIIT